MFFYYILYHSIISIFRHEKAPLGLERSVSSPGGAFRSLLLRHKSNNFILILQKYFTFYFHLIFFVSLLFDTYKLAQWHYFRAKGIQSFF